MLSWSNTSDTTVLTWLGRVLAHIPFTYVQKPCEIFSVAKSPNTEGVRTKIETSCPAMVVKIGPLRGIQFLSQTSCTQKILMRTADLLWRFERIICDAELSKTWSTVWGQSTNISAVVISINNHPKQSTLLVVVLLPNVLQTIWPTPPFSSLHLDQA